MVTMTIWLTMIVITLVAELQNPGLFYFLSLAGGASAALISCLMLQTIDLQIAWFAAIAALSWVVLKRIAQSHRVAPSHRTNTDALLGKRAEVIECIAYPAKGYVKVGGEAWPAKLATNADVSRGSAKLAAAETAEIEIGEFVEVVAVVGNHLVVKRI